METFIFYATRIILFACLLAMMYVIGTPDKETTDTSDIF